MRYKILLGSVVIAFIGLAVFTPSFARETYVALVSRLTDAARAVEQTTVEMQLFELANNFRRSKGLPALAKDEALQGAALAHAMDMMQHKYMGHNASTGHDFDGRMRALRGGAMVLPSMGENAARLTHGGAEAPDAARRIFEQWVKSAPHRQALSSRDYVKVATGVVVQGGVLYADQIFSGPDVKVNFGRAEESPATTLY
ncbi:MAG: CAP domain-containing protein [Alphaproteobacteria bacterium]|nr:CAP domain-containing protein [Alphaproteobacteria bacterium]